MQIGSSYYYGDSTNSAIRQNGTLYIQNQAGTASAGLNAGNTAVNGQLDVTGNINSNGGSVYAAGEVTAGDWLRTNGDTGWYSNKWGGGWYMTDGSWVRAYNGKNVWTPGTLQADTAVQSAYVYSWGNSQTNGNSTTNGYAISNRAWVTNGGDSVGGGCLNGMISLGNNGRVLVCNNGAFSDTAGGALKFGGMFEVQWLGNPYGMGNPNACWRGNPVTGGCSCPWGYNGFQVGLTWHNQQGDGAGYVCYQ